MRNSKYIILSLILFSATLNAQDITGLWKGTLFNDTTQQYNRYEIAISEEKGKLTGFSHTWFLDGDKQYFGVKKVKVKKQDGKVIVEDDELLANNYPVAPAKNVRQLNVLTLQLTDTAEILSGPFATNQTKVYSVLTGFINIQRASDFWQSSLVPHLEEMGLAKRLSFINNDVAVAKTVTIDQPVKPGIVAITEAIVEPIREDVVVAPVVVNTKLFEPPKVVVAKEQAKSKSPVAVNKKMIPAKEEVVKKETPVRKEIPVKKETAAVKGAAVKKDAIVKLDVPVKKDPPVEKEVVISTRSGSEKVDLPIPIVAVPNSANAALNVRNRSTELQQTVYFKSDSLQLSLFDNGEVDGDTVSVLMNGVIIFAKERLSTNAVRKMVAIDPSLDSVQLIMYAENLGTIAPNTGLLVVKDGRDIYEVRFNGNLQKNAAIVFRRRR